jgi:hypothetical protein
MAAKPNMWSVPAGESESFRVTICNAAGPITGTYAGTEALTCVVWEGGNLAPIADVATAAWISGTDATVSVTIAPPADMAPGYYRLKLSVTFGGATSPAHYGWVKVEAIPGTAAEAAVYNTLQDLIDLGGEWVTGLMMSGANDQANFLAERARARAWLDDLIVGQSRVLSYRLDLTFASDFGSFPFTPPEAPDATIRAYLAAGALMISSRTIEATGAKALEYVCRGRQTFDTKGDVFIGRANYFKRLASNAVRRYRCELDTDADGQCDIAFNLGTFSFR